MSLPPATLSVPAPERSTQGSLVTAAAAVGMLFHLVVASATVPPRGVARRHGVHGPRPAPPRPGSAGALPRTDGRHGGGAVALAVVGLVACTGSLPHLGMASGLVMTLVVTTGSASLAWALGLLASTIGLYVALQVASVASLRPVLDPLTGALRSGPHLPGLAPLGGVVTLARPHDLPASPTRTLVVAATSVMGFDAVHRMLRLLHAAASGRAWERFTRLDTGDVLAYALATGLMLWAATPRPTVEPTGRSYGRPRAVVTVALHVAT
jgi:hypothetical protein